MLRTAAIRTSWMMILLTWLAFPTTEATAQSCDSHDPVTISGSLGFLGSTGQMNLTPALQPCETITLTLHATSWVSWGSSGDLEVYNSSGTFLTWVDFGGNDTTVTLPTATSIPGSPYPSTRGTSGQPAYFVLNTNWGIDYSITITRNTRLGYNTGGTGFVNATSIGIGETQHGSIHQTESGQYYQVHVEPGQLIYVQGHATAWPSGTTIGIDLYDQSQQWLKTLAYQGISDPVSFPTSWSTSNTYVNTTGSAQDLYVLVYPGPYMIRDFDFTLKSPSATASFTINAFIRWEWLADPQFGNQILQGDNRWFCEDCGSSRLFQDGTINNPVVSNSGPNLLSFNGVGISQSYDYDTSVEDGHITQAAKDDWDPSWPMKLGFAFADDSAAYCEAAQQSATATLVHCLDSASDPLVVASPSIDFEYLITLTFSIDHVHYSIDGCHDEYPMHEVYVNGSAVIQDVDSGSILSLFATCGKRFHVEGDIQ